MKTTKKDKKRPLKFKQVRINYGDYEALVLKRVEDNENADD